MFVVCNSYIAETIVQILRAKYKLHPVKTHDLLHNSETIKTTMAHLSFSFITNTDIPFFPERTSQ